MEQTAKREELILQDNLRRKEGSRGEDSWVLEEGNDSMRAGR